MASSVPALKESRAVFSRGSRDYTVRDVIDAAHFRGEVAPLWQEFLRRKEAAKRGEESDAELDASAIDEAAIAFRYNYDLITAEETEAWLEARRLTLSDFSEYFARVEWGKTSAGRGEASAFPFEDSDEETRDLFVVDLVLSGELDRMAERFAWRVAASDDEDLENLEAAYRDQCEKRLTKEARERELGAVRLPLTRFAVEVIELESRDAASEAFMCVRDDGMSMEEVARAGRYPFRRMELTLENIPDDMQQRFLSLTPGSLLEPTPRDDGFVLTRLLQKNEPKLDDTEVRERIDQRILSRYFADLASGKIQWRIPPINGGE